MFDKTVINKWPSSVYSYRFVIIAQGRSKEVDHPSARYVYSVISFSARIFLVGTNQTTVRVMPK